MQVQINYADIDSSDALNTHVENEIRHSLEHVEDQITRIEVHLHDDKQKRHGPDDKRCLMEARLAGKKPMAVESKADDIYKAVTETAGKLGRAVLHQVEKRRDA